MDYPGNFRRDVPKGYAAILKAEVMRMRPGDTISRLGRRAGMFLIQHADERHDGFAGWGVPAAWDAYGDGSTNPRDTKYAISNAVVIDALLDWMEADRRAPRARLIRLIDDALAAYADPAMRSPAGLLPYSLEPSDRQYDTFNPAAYLAGVMQRFSVLVDDPARATALRAAADSTMEALLRHRQLTDDGAWYWHYSITEAVPNDLAHAGYIMHGLRLYADNGGTLAAQIDVAAAERHLSDFLRPETGVLHAWPRFSTNDDPARSYDLGMGLYLVCTRQPALRDAYLGSVDSYRAAHGGYLKYPPRDGQQDIRIREYEAYMFMGLTACAQLEGA